MYVTTAELVVVAAALVIFAFAPAVLALVTQRRPRRVAVAREVLPEAAPLAPNGSPGAGAAAIATPSAPPAEPAETPAEAAAQELPEPHAWPPAAGPMRSFELGELRDAGRLEPAATPFLDRSRDTLRAIEATRPDWSARILEAPISVSAYALAGVERAGNRARVVVLLFEELWPAHEASAAARALFELHPDGSLGAAVVEPA